MLFCVSGLCKGQGILDDPSNAFSLAARDGKHILLVFSGSDWCIPCIQFEKGILLDSGFQHYAKESLIILRADFPQKRTISKSLQLQYDALADQFDAAGAFPQIVVLGPDKKLLGTLSFAHQSPADFAGEIRQLLNDK
jgi:thioredoxin-related protein